MENDLVAELVGITGSQRQALELTVRSDRLVAFGDGIETDALALGWGQSVRIAASSHHLRLVR